MTHWRKHVSCILLSIFMVSVYVATSLQSGYCINNPVQCTWTSRENLDSHSVWRISTYGRWYTEPSWISWVPRGRKRHWHNLINQLVDLQILTRTCFLLFVVIISAPNRDSYPTEIRTKLSSQPPVNVSYVRWKNENSLKIVLLSNYQSKDFWQ